MEKQISIVASEDRSIILANDIQMYRTTDNEVIIW